ncbi:von Willebrand factor-like [Topomyia yanbarensis]|uniref:von Willebrand factor-like n=1 Tax=Topomyia yanbarensis TaxID=2498891 RepID=UPI00273BDE60|nr:von Willebrand factor-like [Topomyia yanbarensis]
MNNGVLLVFATICCMLIQAAPNEICGPNEIFSNCGPSCPQTCESLFMGEQPCGLRCEIGCFCQEGLIRKANGECVHPSECQLYRNNLRPPCESKYSTVNYIAQQCRGASHRSEASTFLKMKLALVAIFAALCTMAYAVPQCASDCRGPNEVFSNCGSACPLTCDSWQRGPQPCASSCQSGCICQPGFVRNIQGTCIEPALCPRACNRPPFPSYH